GAVRVHRVAWTVADLAGTAEPGLAELDVALRLRTGEPLLLGSIPRPTTDDGREDRSREGPDDDLDDPDVLDDVPVTVGRGPAADGVPVLVALPRQDGGLR
ncbi:MAG: Magnesium chelatase, partial [Marmoricola sp.]|nr:Magnesium chelatase [Marmoricola sp.]